MQKLLMTPKPLCYICSQNADTLRHLLSLLLIVVVGVLVGGCASSKAYLKKGTQLSQAGLTEEAANYYYMALQKNSNNVDAQIMLKKTAQRVLDDKFAEFYKAHGAEQYKIAVYEYEEAKEFQKQMERFVTLEEAAYYPEYYEESKEKYLEELYEEGVTLFEEGKFELAEEKFKEIARFDPHYADIKDLKQVSKAEPLYNEGIEAYEARKYKEAFLKFDEVIELKGRYKDALEYRDRAREKAELTIALLPVESSTDIEQEIKDRYYGKILSELLAADNEFIKVVDRVNMDKVIEEQKLGLTGLIDQSTAAQTGKLVGAKIVITGKLVDLEMEGGDIQKQVGKGYQKIRKRKYNPVGKYYYFANEYEKVTYDEFQGRSRVTASFEVQLISSETGEVLLSESFNLTRTDEVAYVVFEGDHRALYPGTWESKSRKSATDQVYSSVAQKQQLDRMLASRKRRLKSTLDLKVEMIEEIAEKIAKKITEFEEDRS